MAGTESGSGRRTPHSSALSQQHKEPCVKPNTPDDEPKEAVRQSSAPRPGSTTISDIPADKSGINQFSLSETHQPLPDPNRFQNYPGRIRHGLVLILAGLGSLGFGVLFLLLALVAPRLSIQAAEALARGVMTVFRGIGILLGRADSRREEEFGSGDSPHCDIEPPNKTDAVRKDDGSFGTATGSNSAKLSEFTAIIDMRNATSSVRLQLPRSVASEMMSLATAQAPLMCCGVLAGEDQRRVSSVVKAVRYYPLANKLRSGERYLVNPSTLLIAMGDIQRNRLTIVAIFHSVMDSEPHPDSSDVEWDHFPNAMLLLMSLQTKTPEMRCWRRTGNLFHESAWETTKE